MPVERRVVLQPVPENLLPLSVRKLENLEGEIPVYGVVSVHFRPPLALPLGVGLGVGLV
ncbi:MAG: hypothetical protein R3E12_13715 [Candidatus Eisenbacteria bacterium]